MRILVACEYSGTVREAFKAKGHYAMSCDLLPTEIPGEHYQGDVFDIIGDGWDMMIAFPPCTYLSFVGLRHWNKPGRKENRDAAADFFMRLWNADIPKIAIENPLGHMSRVFRKPDQVIHPYYFGDPVKKRTCIWLKNIPKLTWSASDTLFQVKTSTDKPKPLYFLSTTGKPVNWVEGIKGCGKDRSKERARFWPSIAQAMADQWG